MSITDELREAINELRVECEEKEGCGVLWYPEPTRDRFSEIADRIDKEHEDELTMERGRAITELGSDIARNYVQLPKDADGETIHLGDELEFSNGDRTMRGTVQALSDCWVVFGEGPYYGVKSCRHVTPDSWESIISEFAERVLRSGHQWGLDAPAATAEFVERCKRLAGEDA